MVEIIHTSPPTPSVEPAPAPQPGQAPAQEAGQQPSPAMQAPAPPAGGGIPAPEFLLPKFKSVEEQARAYVELEKTLGQRPAQAGIQEAPAAPAEAPKAPGTPIQKQLEAEFSQTGQISPQSRAAFSKATGLPESFIDSHLEYLQMREQRAVGEIHSAVGGKAVYEEMTAWAAQNLSPEEIQTYNGAVYSGDKNLAGFAVQGLMAKYQQSMGRHPKFIAGRRPTQAGVVPFQSADEWKIAMRDPRYHADESFRNEVADRLRAGQELGLL